MKILALLFFGQGLNFVIAVVNIRAASKGMLRMTMASDFVFSAVNFTLITHIAKASNNLETFAYALGGACGSGLAIYLTRHWDS